ncbi:hypothetical protein ACEE94_10670 [Staphylococcus epidermidis]
MEMFETIMTTVHAAVLFIAFFGGMFILPMYSRYKEHLIAHIEYKMRNLSYSNYEINIRGKYLDKQSISSLKKIDQKLQIKMEQKFNNPEDKITDQNFFITHR